MRKLAIFTFSVWSAAVHAAPPFPAWSLPALDAAVRAACPQIDGVSADGAVFFQPGASCQSAANAAVQDFVPTAPVPRQVSAMQAKVALSRAGLLASVNSWIASQNAETQLIWSSATTFDRDSQLIASASAALGLSSAQVDQLFVLAASINP